MSGVPVEGFVDKTKELMKLRIERHRIILQLRSVGETVPDFDILEREARLRAIDEKIAKLFR